MKNWIDWKIEEIGLNGLPAGLSEVNPKVEKLFYRGDWDLKLFDKAVAVVGSRRMTRYGEGVVRMLVGGLVEAGYTIVSGFMYGVDTAAHRACLEGGGKTVAVFGCGLNQVTPAQNDKLYSQILAGGGLVMSEYEAEMKARLWTFPQRNRIVAGLSQGTLVIEGGEKSGSLITAKISLKLGRKVMAVPGQAGASQSIATNWLIRNGGVLVSRMEEVLEELAPHSRGKLVKESKGLKGIHPSGMSMSGEEKMVFEELKRESLDVDELSRRLKWDVVRVGRLLSEMSLKGLVEEFSGKYMNCLT